MGNQPSSVTEAEAPRRYVLLSSFWCPSALSMFPAHMVSNAQRKRRRTERKAVEKDRYGLCTFLTVFRSSSLFFPSLSASLSSLDLSLSVSRVPLLVVLGASVVTVLNVTLASMICLVSVFDQVTLEGKPTQAGRVERSRDVLLLFFFSSFCHVTAKDMC